MLLTTLTFAIEPAPSTPLNLRFNVLYAPRVPTPPYVAHRATEESASGLFVITSYTERGSQSVMRVGTVIEAWQSLALALRMDR